MSENSDWQSSLTARIGRNIQEARKHAGVSAQKLADRCTELGLPMHRDTLANLENGRRASVTIAEVLILAAALDRAPVALLYPTADPEELTEYLPGVELTNFDAYQRFSALPAGGFQMDEDRPLDELRLGHYRNLLASEKEALEAAVELSTKFSPTGAPLRAGDSLELVKLRLKGALTSYVVWRYELGKRGVDVAPPHPLIDELAPQHVEPSIMALLPNWT
jgi:transcriptional regulator with XRE-family HTH domain